MDKLSEYPYMALLFNGWGFGVEYNEPRGHHYMLIDQLEVDPSRLKAGGVCLTCKTPFAPKLRQEMGVHYFKDPYMEVHAKIPAQFQTLGVLCIDCHDNKTMDLQFSRWTLDQGPQGHRLRPGHRHPAGETEPGVRPVPRDLYCQERQGHEVHRGLLPLAGQQDGGHLH